MGTYNIFKYSNNKWENLCSQDEEIRKQTQKIETDSSYRIEKNLLKKYYPNKKLLSPKEPSFSDHNICNRRLMLFKRYL